MLSPYYYQIMVIICINVILALSLNLITGFAGQLSLGHAAFMGIGAYTSGILTSILGAPFPGSWQAAWPRLHADWGSAYRHCGEELPGHRDPGFEEIIRVAT